MDVAKFLALFTAAAVGSVLLSALFSIPVWLIWNALVTDIFSLRAISFIEAFWLVILAGLLFNQESASGK